MAKWFFYDENGYRIGPLDDAALKNLALDGTLLPDSTVETEAGKKAKAESIKGLTFISHDLNSKYFVPPPPPIHPQSYASPAGPMNPDARLVSTAGTNSANVPIIIDPKNWSSGAWLILLSAGLAILSFILPWQDIFDGWQNAPKNRDDMIFEVEVKSVTFADGITIKSSVFTPDDAEKLREARSQAR